LQFGQTGVLVRPVMDGEDAERCVERAVPERQMLRHATNAPRAAMLVEHHAARIHGHDPTIARLVAPRAGADIEDALGVA
jgi:hypothetical protein